jgi:RHS repeat-associated protein
VINVSAAKGMLYFVHVDHLNTPRLIADSFRRTVWRWENDEPFGDSPSDENPSGLGVFAFNLGFPGQLRDVETGNWHNWMRDYSSLLGRYIQSDPIGLEDGLNTYAYVGGMPVRYSDPTGLESYRCRRPLGQLPGKNKRSGPDIWGNPFYHQYSCTRDPKTKKLVCGGQGFSNSWWSSPGEPTTSETDYYDSEACEKTQDDNPCFEKCLIDEWGKKRPKYGLPFGMDCQEYDESVNTTCREKCKLK